MKNNIIKELKLRNLIIQISNEKKIKKYIKNKNISIYCGFDTTNDSLHIGHLIPLLTLKRFQNYGYKIIIVIGEFTSLIGDPSFQNKKRKKYNIKKILKFSKKIIKQIKKIIPNNIIIKKNNKWFKNMKIDFFLKNLCNNFIINKMLNKEAIKKRNISNKKGISFKELSYPILQSYDFLHLFNTKNTKIQIGGSDQWGNIISGINLINKINKKKSFGITLPLITKKNGQKYSKSEKNIIWLDEKKTTPYEFYQFWLNIEDNKILNYIKQFTFLKYKKIKKIKKNKNINELKKILAKKITKIVHGKKNIKEIKFITKFYFSKNRKISIKKLKKIFNFKIPKIILKKKNKKLKNILILLKITKTKSESNKLIYYSSIKINNIVIKDINYKINKKDKYFNKFTILQKGKKKFFLIKWI